METLDPDGPPVAIHYEISLTPDADAALRLIQLRNDADRNDAINEAIVLYWNARMIVGMHHAAAELAGEACQTCAAS
ncbi:hypothetical protein [Stackebrandtia soli]|uniref:hypothetical protein n=1 Tax=Stackebrandtia soli TaxID=1892856 RepID=UPI0039ECF77E